MAKTVRKSTRLSLIMRSILILYRWVCASIALFPGLPLIFAAAPTNGIAQEDLSEVQKVTLPFLRSVTSATISDDGRFLYAAAFNAGVVSVFARDPGTGFLDAQDEITTPDLQAVVRVRLSPDGAYACAAAFGANAVTVFKRNPSTGQLTLVDTARKGENDAAGLDFVIDASFSKDDRFLYTAEANGVGVFKLEGDKLTFIQHEIGGGQLSGVRCVTLSPTGPWLYATAYMSGTLAVLRRDEATGTVKVVQILKNDQDDVTALEGAFRVACSPDGKHLYVSSGRFKGDQAVSAFEITPEGKLKLIEEHVNGVGGFTGFQGGNDIAVSPDGTRVYAVASLSDRLVRFRRNADSGKLTFLGSQQVGEMETPGSAGVCFSPDGKFVYVADEDANAIVSFKER
jgi:6-phosphogluconolactonase (cycloisomerase 2 family)